MGVLISLTAIFLTLTSIAHEASCPSGWYVEGVRPSGHTQCRPVPPKNCGEPKPPHNQACPHDDRKIELQIYCTGGASAIVVSDRVVGCQRI